MMATLTVVPQRNGIDHVLSSSDNDEDVTRKWIRQLKEKEGNNVCADCGAEGQIE
jgi:peroxiredoxin